MIKDSIRSSESLALLTADEERHFYRLILIADDHGRFDARPMMIRSACYPLQVESITLAEVLQWTDRLASPGIGILTLYEVDGKKYGAFVKWKYYQRVRSPQSKYPEPPTLDSNARGSSSPMRAAMMSLAGDGAMFGGPGPVPKISPVN